MHHKQRYCAKCYTEPKENVQGSRWACYGSHYDSEDLEKVHLLQQLPSAQIPDETGNRNPSSIQALAAKKPDTEKAEEAAYRPFDSMERDARGV